MKIFNWLKSKIFSRDKPQNLYRFSNFPFFFGKSVSGKNVNEFAAMQNSVVYACCKIISESIASLPLHVYQYKNGGKEKVPKHPLYFLLHDSPNDEMTSFVFRETLMTHLLLWGNAYAQIIRNNLGKIAALYSLLPNKIYLPEFFIFISLCFLILISFCKVFSCSDEEIITFAPNSA